MKRVGFSANATYICNRSQRCRPPNRGIVNMSLWSPHKQPRRPSRARVAKQRQAGTALIVVLMILATALASSYAVMRNQSTQLVIQENANHRGRARDASLAGLAFGLRKMHQNDWAGVNTSLPGNVGQGDRFEVRYYPGITAADGTPVLPASDDLEAQAVWPFCVTLVSTGVSPGTATAMHRTRAVVKLVPRQLAAEPTSWSEVIAYTLQQFSAGDGDISVPIQINGPVRLRSQLYLGYPKPDSSHGYDWSTVTRHRYLSDLNAMRLAGAGDLRPFTGPLTLPRVFQDAAETALLETRLGLTVNDGSSLALSDWSYPGEISSYRLYPGGKLYQVPHCSSSLTASTVLEPDPQTNPAGVFYCSSDVTVGDNVSLRGMLVGNGSIRLTGQGVRLQPLDLPPLADTTEPVQLPTLLARNDLKVFSSYQGESDGMVAVWDDLEIQRGSYSTSFHHQGQVIANDLQMYERSADPNWDLSLADWDALYQEFLAQLATATSIEHFPAFLLSRGYNPVPRISLNPPASPARTHWLRNGQAIYVAQPSDEGLVWELLQWHDET